MIPCLRFRISALVLSVSALSFATRALADTMTAGVYNLNNASVTGYSITGTVTMNTSGVVTAANLTFNDPNFLNTVFPDFTSVVASYSYNGLSQTYITGPNLGTGQISLFFNTTANDNGYLGLCLNGSQCGTSTTASSTLQIYGFYNGVSNPGLNVTNFSGGYLSNASGATSAIAVTPEPTTLLLLGTGVLGVPFLLQRRYRSASGPAVNTNNVLSSTHFVLALE